VDTTDIMSIFILKKFMSRILKLIIIVLLLFSCNDGVDTEILIPFEMYRGLPITEMQLNGLDAKFLIDTGATSSVLNIDCAVVYEFEYVDVNDSFFTGASGTQIRSGLVRNAWVHSKGKRINVDFKGLEMPSIRERYGVVGILGSDIFNNNDCIIDYDNKLIIIRR